MLIKTKKFKLEKKKYIKFALLNLLRMRWWVPTVLVGGSVALFGYTKSWWSILLSVAALVYIGFWWIQFYGVTQLDKNQLIFERMSYKINSSEITMALNPKYGMSIPWAQIRYARQGRDHFLLFISKAQIIHLPYKGFEGPHDIQLMTTLLKQKKLIK